MARSKWHTQGRDDFAAGLCDPPWHPGHRDYVRYMEGWKDREAEEETAAPLDFEGPEE